jgi:restriction system protein
VVSSSLISAGNSVLGIIAYIVILWGAYQLLAGRARPKAVRRIAEPHRAALGRRWLQTVTADEYGGEDVRAWLAACRYFLDWHIAPALGPLGRRWLYRRGLKPAYRIVGGIARASAAQITAGCPSPGADPLAYERYCAGLLAQHGWRTALTRRSGDQGVDIIAHRAAVCVVLQCKLYGQPVGNGAVQEIAAGRAHAGALFAVVVSNAAFTSSARQLATSNRVLLLHHSQLGELARLCGIG